MKNNQEKVMAFVNANPKCDVESITKETGVFKLQVHKLLKGLVESNAVTMEKDGEKFVYSAGKPTKTKPSVALFPAKEEEEDLGPKNSLRDTSKFSFGGEQFTKGRLVHAVIKKHVETNKKITLAKLQEIFKSTEIQPRFGVIMEITKAKKLSQDRDRYFLKAGEPIRLSDGKSICVTNQWSAENLKPFLKVARSLGHNIR